MLFLNLLFLCLYCLLPLMLLLPLMSLSLMLLIIFDFDCRTAWIMWVKVTYLLFVLLF